jgi:hypothetical protein
LPLDHTILRLHAVIADLLALNPLNMSRALRHALDPGGPAVALDACLTLDAGRAGLPLDMLRPLALDRCKALLTLHPLATAGALNVGRLALHRAPLGCLGMTAATAAAASGLCRLLAVIVVVATARSGGCRRGNRQRGDAGSKI